MSTEFAQIDSMIAGALTDSVGDYVPLAARREAARLVRERLGLHTIDRRSVSRTLPQFGGQAAYYNPDAARNGGAIAEHIASLPVEFRVVGDWRPET